MLTQNMEFGLLENAYVPFSCACPIATLSAITGVFSFVFKKLIFTTSSQPRQVQDSEASARILLNLPRHPFCYLQSLAHQPLAPAGASRAPPTPAATAGFGTVHHPPPGAGES